MTKPLIGITTHSDGDSQRAPLDRFLLGCVAALEAAGGLPVLIPHGLAAETVAALVSRLDGVLLTGGGDLDACHYAGAAHAGISGVDEWRDRTEIALARQVVEREIPFFGICRGCQVLNVALGGTLHPEVAEVPGAIQHTYYPGHPFDLLSHWVDVEEGSRMAALTGQRRFQVNSLHHQSIARLAAGLQATAVAPDGLAEAVEVRGHPFGLAVQWHPEVLPGESSTQALFAGFVAACGSRRAAYASRQ